MNYLYPNMETLWGYSTLQQCEVRNYHTPLRAPIQHTILGLDGGMFSLAHDAVAASWAGPTDAVDN